LEDGNNMNKDSFYLGRFFAVDGMFQRNEISSEEAAILCAQITSDYQAGKTADEVVTEALKGDE
jgi:hypothetical protein